MKYKGTPVTQKQREDQQKLIDLYTTIFGVEAGEKVAQSFYDSNRVQEAGVPANG